MHFLSPVPPRKLDFHFRRRVGVHTSNQIKFPLLLSSLTKDQQIESVVAESVEKLVPGQLPGAARIGGQQRLQAPAKEKEGFF